MISTDTIKSHILSSKPGVFATDSHATSNLSMTGDTVSAFASGEPDVLEAVLMESGYNYATSKKPNDSQTNHKETSWFYEQETCVSQNQVYEKYDNGENYSWGYVEGFWTDENDSQETGSYVSNAMDSGTS